MTLDDLLTRLAGNKAVIVHFSHHADMRPGTYFPNDLKNAIVNKDKWNLSCCVLWPRHEMDLPGSVGVIFEPVSPSNILSVCADDSGSSVGSDGSDQSAGEPLSEESFSRTFSCEPGRYNEWRVNGAAVKGIFIAAPNFIHAKMPVTIDTPEMPDFIKSEGKTIAPCHIHLSAVFDAFPGLPIFSMTHSGLVALPRPNP